MILPPNWQAIANWVSEHLYLPTGEPAHEHAGTTVYKSRLCRTCDVTWIGHDTECWCCGAVVA